MAAKGTDRKSRKEILEALDKSIKQLELKLLDAELQVIEDRIAEYEKILSPGSFEDVANKFIQEVMNRYEPLVKSMCRNMEKAGICTYMNSDDFMQEGLEYLVRWCLPKVYKFSSPTNLWMPYLKRSFHNSFVNLQKRFKSALRGKETLGMDFWQENSMFLDDTYSPDAEVEASDLAFKVAERLDPFHRRVFYDLIYTPPDLSEFAAMRRAAHRKISTKRILSEYYGVSVDDVKAAFEAFRSTISFCCSH